MADCSSRFNRTRHTVRRLILSLLLLASTGCTRFEILNATVPSWGYHKTDGRAYGQAHRQKLDVYQPRRQRAGAPVVVFFYGGGWQQGQRRDYQFVAEAFTSRGYVTVIPDYRLYPEVTFPAFVRDGARAVRWVRDHAAAYGADPDRIFLVGHSAGATIATLLTFDERYLDAAGVDRSAIIATAGLGGPYDFRATGTYADIFPQQDDPAAPYSFVPLRYVDGDEPPTLLLQGSADGIVDPDNAMRLARQIRRSGGVVRYISVRGGGHSDDILSLAWSFRWRTPALREIVRHFRSAERSVEP